MTTHQKIQQFAQKAFIVHDNSLLCARKSKDEPNWPLYWEIPGGRMNFGEDVDNHICREVREETGLEIIPGQPFYIWQWVFDRHDKQHQVIAVARLATLKNEGHIETSMDGHEADEYLDKIEWVPLVDLPNLKWIPNMKPVIDAFLKIIQS